MMLRSSMRYLVTLSCVILCIVPSRLILTSEACEPKDDAVFVANVYCAFCDDTEARFQCVYDGFENGCGETFAGCPDGSSCHFASAANCQVPVADLKHSLLPRDQIAAFTIASAGGSLPSRCNTPFWSWINRHASTAPPKKQNQGGL